MRDLITDIIAEFVSIPHIHAARSAEFKTIRGNFLGNSSLRPQRTKENHQAVLQRKMSECISQTCKNNFLNS